MSSVDRVMYMDNQRTMVITENIEKEKKIQRKYFQDQEAAGKVAKWEPEPPRLAQTVGQRVGVPEHVKELKADPEQLVRLTLSQNMWTANPGYIIRDGKKLKSVAHQDHVWDEEEIEYMKAAGLFNKPFNRRRDGFTRYIEASAMFSKLIKSTAGGK